MFTGLVFLFFEAFPISFSEDRGMSPGIASLTFISILVGVLIGCVILATTTKTKLAPNPAEGRSQETRLLLMFAGAVVSSSAMRHTVLHITNPSLFPGPPSWALLVVSCTIILSCTKTCTLTRTQRLDVLSLHHTLAPNHRRYPDRLQRHHDHPARHELCDRLLHHQCQFSACRHDIRTVVIRWRLPAFRAGNVS